jgi:PAS domain S-box-containing protein
MSDDPLGDAPQQTSDDAARFWELSSDLLCCVGSDGYVKRLNPAWERTLGWTLEELRSRPLVDLVHPDDRERALSDVSRYRCRDGSYRTLLWSATSIPEEGLIYAAGKDVTASREAQEQLQRSERFLDSVLENLPTMVFVKDADELRFVRVNKAEEDLLGIPREELIGKRDHDLFPKQAADGFVQKDREVLASGEIIDVPEEAVQTMSGGTRILHTRKIAIRDERGEPRYLLGISEDISDRRAAERAASAARAEAELANQAKSQFLSRMSHELRTPLNAVIGFGQLLELDDLDEHQTEAVEQILRGGRHLLELINEVLDISRIESGTMTLSLEPVHLQSVLSEALLLIRPLADEAHVRVTSDDASSADVHVFADRQRLQQVLLNLLSNAVKYNRRDGRVTVRCSRLPDGLVEIAVADTGLGMSAEQLVRLFEPFNRLGAEVTDVEGTGLGLCLVKGFVEAMAGTIQAESEPGAGSTMRVRLAAAESSAGEAPAHGGPSAPSSRNPDLRTIVHIDDNDSNLRLVKRLFEGLPGVRLIPAMERKLGLDLVREHHPDLILLDFHLPDGDGREVLQQLKADPATASIPVVVLSAYDSRDQVDRLRAAGAVRFLSKPIDPKALLGAVQDILAPRGQGVPKQPNTW